MSLSLVDGLPCLPDLTVANNSDALWNLLSSYVILLSPLLRTRTLAGLTGGTALPKGWGEAGCTACLWPEKCADPAGAHSHGQAGDSGCPGIAPPSPLSQAAASLRGTGGPLEEWPTCLQLKAGPRLSRKGDDCPPILASYSRQGNGPGYSITILSFCPLRFCKVPFEKSCSSSPG